MVQGADTAGDMGYPWTPGAFLRVVPTKKS